MRARGAQFLVIGGGALVFREDARPFIAAECVAGGFYLGNKTGDRIGGVFDIEAPEGDRLPTEPVVDLQRLGTKGALAEAAGALHDMQMPSLAQITAQRVHFLAAADKTSLEHSCAAIRIGCL